MSSSGITNFFVMTKKSMYTRDIVNLGFVKIGDLISANISFPCGIISHVNPEQRFFLMSIINSISAERRSVLKASTEGTVTDPLPNTPAIRMESNNLVPIFNASAKQIYFLRKKTDSTHCQTEINEQVPKHCN